MAAHLAHQGRAMLFDTRLIDLSNIQRRGTCEPRRSRDLCLLGRPQYKSTVCCLAALRMVSFWSLAVLDLARVLVFRAQTMA
jgi:hypothetical protein